MYLDNYACTWEAVQIILKSPDDKKCDSIRIERPQQMWNNVTGEWEDYNPTVANKAFQAVMGNDVNIEGYHESEKVRRITYTRADGYQIAVIRFLMEG